MLYAFDILSVGIGLAFFAVARMQTGKQYIVRERKKKQKKQDRKASCREWEKIESIAGKNKMVLAGLLCFRVWYGSSFVLPFF